MRLVFFLFLSLMCFAVPAWAQEDAVPADIPQEVDPSASKEVFPRTGPEVERFVSLRSDEVNVRTGPGKRYPISWVYHRRGLPVEVVVEYDTWRKIKDSEGSEGWVHKSMLSGTRSFVVQGNGEQMLYRKPQGAAPVMARLQPGVIGVLKSCAGDWCEVEVSGLKGYANRASLWGVKDGEVVK